MIKCPFCQFENEEGALFCEQCKSDLAGSELIPLATPVASATSEESSPLVTPIEGILPETIPVREETEQPATMSLSEVQAATTSTDTVSSTVPTVPETARAPGPPLPADAKPVLVVLRGLKVGLEYPVYEGMNFIGRTDDKPVDIDLEDQEPPDRIWCSRQHACIQFENGSLTVEDLNSSNGTFVNRTRVYPGQKRPLQVNDVIQIGTVQLKVKA